MGCFHAANGPAGFVHHGSSNNWAEDVPYCKGKLLLLTVMTQLTRLNVGGHINKVFKQQVSMCGLISASA